MGLKTTYRNYKVSYKLRYNHFTSHLLINGINEEQVKDAAIKQINGAYGSELCRNLEILKVEINKHN